MADRAVTLAVTVIDRTGVADVGLRVAPTVEVVVRVVTGDPVTEAAGEAVRVVLPVAMAVGLPGVAVLGVPVAARVPEAVTAGDAVIDPVGATVALTVA